MTTAAPTKTAQLAQTLVEKCRERDFLAAIDATYAPNVVTEEPVDMPGMPKRLEGFDAVREANAMWVGMHDIHTCQVSDPLVSDTEFAVRFEMDVTHKPSGRRMQMTELAVYQVAGDKITQVRFFYDASGCTEGL